MDNLFTKIINQEIPSYKIYEDQDVYAFLDIAPKNNGHFLVLPKKPSVNLFDIDDQTLTTLVIKTRKLALLITKKLGVESFMVHINNGAPVGQEVFYTHIHIIPAENQYNWKLADLANYLKIDQNL